MRREARKRTWRSENFFSSSRVRLRELGGSVMVGSEWDGTRGGVPLLDFVEAGKEGHGDEDDDCFFAVPDFELWVGETGIVSLCVCVLPVRNSCTERLALEIDSSRSQA